MIKTRHLFTRRLLPSLIAGVVAASAHGAGDEVINTTVIGEQFFISDSTSITVQSGGSITSTGFTDGISLDDAGGHNLTVINVDVEAIVSAGWDAIYTGEGDVTIGSITIAGDLLSTSVPGGIGVAIDFGTTVTNDVIFTGTGTFVGSGSGPCESGLAISCGVIQSGALVIGTVTGDLVNQGNITAKNGLSVVGFVEQTTGTSVVGSLGGDLINSGTMTVDGDAGLFVLGGASVGGSVINDGTITATDFDATGIKISGKAFNYDDNANVDDIDGFVAGSVQTVVTGDVINNGMITGGFDGIAINEDVLIGGDVINTGTINVSGALDGDAAAIYIGDDDDIAGALPTITGSVINSGTLINDSTLETDPIDRIATVELNGSINNGFFNNVGGTITNLETLGTAIRTYNSTDITNQGTINGAVRMNGGTLTNSAGVINGTLHYAGSGGGISNNADVISASGTAIFVNNGTLSGSIINGTGANIDGSNGGIIAIQSTITGGVSNDGNISSLGPSGPAMNNAYAVDIQQTTISSVDNSGTITGGLILEDVTISGGVFNDGTIQSAQAGGDAVVIRGTTNIAFVDNIGILSGEGGVLAEDGATIGTIFNDGVITGSSGIAIAAVNGSTISSIFNNGTINGAVDFGNAGGIFYASGGRQGSSSSSGEIIGATEIFVDTGVAGINTATINGDLTFDGLLAVYAFAEDGLGFTANGHLNVTGDVDVTGASVLVVLDTGSITAEGDEFSFLSAGGTLTSDITGANGVDIEIGSSVLGFTVERRGQALFAIAGVSDFSVPLEEALADAGLDGTAGGDNIGNVADTLTAIVDNEELLADVPTDSELAEAIGNLQGGGLDDNQITQALASLDPETVEASSVGAMAADTAAAGSVNNRQTALRGDYGFSGAVAGDALSIHGFWMQGYANDTDQDVRDGVDGFDADSVGFAMGIDSPISESVNVGAAFSFATTDVEAKLESNEMTIDSYRLALYGSYNAENYYIDGQLAYAVNEYETNRAIDPNLTATPLIARGDHDGDQYSLRVRAGYPIATESGWFITPKAEIDYTYLSEDNYTEKGAGNLGLDIATADVEVLVVGVGVKFAYPITTASEQVWIPELSVDYLYDMIGDEVEIDSNFIGVTGAGFITQGANTEQEMIKVSLRMRAFGQGNLSFSGGFDYIQKDDYKSQSFMATVRYDF